MCGVPVLQRPLTWLLRSVLVLPAFVGIMLPRAQTADAFYNAYDNCVNVSSQKRLYKQSCAILDAILV